MIKRYICFIITLGLIAGPFLVSAQQWGQGGGLQNPLKAQTFDQLISAIASIVTKIGGTLAVLFIIWSGFLFVSARGSEEQIKKAKTVFQWTIIGTAVLLGAAVIAEVVVNFMKSL